MQVRLKLKSPFWDPNLGTHEKSQAVKRKNTGEINNERNENKRVLHVPGSAGGQG